jgi:hypothetical protein
MIQIKGILKPFTSTKGQLSFYRKHCKVRQLCANLIFKEESVPETKKLISDKMTEYSARVAKIKEGLKVI